jgi:hypothetical protein
MEQRQYPRINDNAEVYISDQAGFCTGTLKDFSRFGLCITDLPRRVRSKNGFFEAIFTFSNLKFRLQVEEKWNETEGLTNIVGAHINNAAWDWTEMVIQHEAVDDDVWGNRQYLHA